MLAGLPRSDEGLGSSLRVFGITYYDVAVANAVNEFKDMIVLFATNLYYLSHDHTTKEGKEAFLVTTFGKSDYNSSFACVGSDPVEAMALLNDGTRDRLCEKLGCCMIGSGVGCSSTAMQ